MKIILSIMVLLVSNITVAEDLLKDYDTTKPSHSMSCWTGQTGWKKYEIIGKQLVVDNVSKVDYQQNKGNIFAVKTNNIFGTLILIIDYDQMRVTQTLMGIKEVFDCN